MKKLILLAAAVLFSLPSASFAQRIVVRVAPPPVVVEHPGPRPHPGWVWIDGHHQWDGRRYVWAHGYWIAPPRPHAVWVRGHWRHAHGGYVWVDGHWR
jgi:WXXGXW repeat (2 copies)